MSLITHDPTSHRSVDRLDTTALADIVSGLAVADELWRPHVAHNAEERTRIRLIATSSYEVWLLGWTSGQSVGLHDHGDANGAFIVVDGDLTEIAAAEPGDRRYDAHENAPPGRHRQRPCRRHPRRGQPLHHTRHEHPRLLETAAHDELLRGVRPGRRKDAHRHLGRRARTSAAHRNRRLTRPCARPQMTTLVSVAAVRIFSRPCGGFGKSHLVLARP